MLDFFLNAIRQLIFVIAFPAICQGATIAWFYALDQEKANFEQLTGEPKRSVISGTIVIHEYGVGPHRVVAVRMGSGCVATAVSVSTALALYAVDRVISTGPAGRIGGDSEIGVWKRINEVCAWQKGKLETGGRILPGATFQVPWVATEWPTGDWSTFGASAVASGEAFIASEEARSEISAITRTSLVEMNAFGLLQALDGRNVKLLILRVISDNADSRASDDFAGFVKSYDGKGGSIVAELVKNLPIDKNEPRGHEALKKLLGD